MMMCMCSRSGHIGYEPQNLTKDEGERQTVSVKYGDIKGPLYSRRHKQYWKVLLIESALS